MKRQLKECKDALNEKNSRKLKEIENCEDVEEVEKLIQEIRMLIDGAGVDSDYYARFIFLYKKTSGLEEYNKYKGKEFDPLIEKGLVCISSDSDSCYILNDGNKRNEKILKKLKELQELIDYLEMEEDLYDMSITDADFWKEKMGYNVIR